MGDMLGAYGTYGSGAMMGIGAWNWILILVPLIISAIAQMQVTGAYRKYSRMPVYRNITGAQFAQQMLNDNNIHSVGIQPVPGELSDHYDPRTDTVNLSPKIYRDSSVASIAVAAHECGHVLQKYTGYGAMKLRGALVPATNLCSQASFFLIMLGIIFSAFSSLVTIGAWMYFVVVLFQIVTLPVEFNASHRALQYINASGVLEPGEEAGAKAMLRAAAMTYVASMLAGFLTFIRLLLIARGRNRN